MVHAPLSRPMNASVTTSSSTPLSEFATLAGAWQHPVSSSRRTY
ncbi:hypothetical protein STRCI_000252 [Streptomyces cinnabarinus]|uniref:Uncharacterized protein n=1 Tax=Streptomyces cinnabarinus TaxID=67287 RepID=A0ABY7K428_9ACTN|nr:hypothetical protein [Streptomyces cinnabarinus]WAZ19217.1 hypothetical protein STRCI_000252 [Streptomyces cinnabarinus]